MAAGRHVAFRLLWNWAATLVTLSCDTTPALPLGREAFCASRLALPPAALESFERFEAS
jgi:hypothetical protein